MLGILPFPYEFSNSYEVAELFNFWMLSYGKVEILERISFPLAYKM